MGSTAEAFEAAARERLGDGVAADFLHRVRLRLPVVTSLLDRLYGDAAVELVPGVLTVVLNALAERPEPLRALDRARAADPGWFLRPDRVGYVCYVDRFAGTLTGLAERLDYLDELGVGYLHLMPLLASRDGENDGGYAVRDYDAVDARLGTMADLSALADRLHDRGIALCVDLALNHTAREHEWAERAVAGDRTYRDFYLIFPDRTLPDDYERTALDIFPELAPGTFTHVPELGWVWTSFREFQWDLNFANPAVFQAMLAVMLRLANRGPDVVRIDAAPFLWKRLGTTCLDEPEVHLLLQAFRALTWMAAPGVLLKAEAMLEPDAVLRYLGSDSAPPECDLAYDNQAMVMLWSAFALGDARLATRALSRRHPPPTTATWVTYVRCHDDIGWAIDDLDAASVGADGDALRSRISDFYAGISADSYSLGARFQINEHGAHPVSGTAASLCGVEAAMRQENPHLLATALRRLESMYSIVFSVGGIPLVYMGDELALVNVAQWEVDPAHHGDNRWMHRPEMDWTAAQARYDARTVAGRAHARVRALSAARRATEALHAGARLNMIGALDPGLLAYTRGATGEFLAVVNLTVTPRTVRPDVLGRAGIDDVEILHATEGISGLVIPPAGFAWLRQRGHRPAK